MPIHKNIVMATIALVECDSSRFSTFQPRKLSYYREINGFPKERTANQRFTTEEKEEEEAQE